MLFVIHSHDKKDGLPIRQATRAAHLEHLKTIIDNIVFAGPTLSEHGEAGYMNGSVIIVDFADQAAADAFVANDPYTKAGLPGSCTVQPIMQALPKK